MKKKLLLPLLLAGGLCSTPAFAETYVSGSVGLGMMGKSDASSAAGTQKDAIEYKAGVPFGVALGYKANEYRAEVAVGYQSNSVDKSWNGTTMATATDTDVTTLSVMANGYRDFAIKDSGVSPYVMAGVGMASIKAKDATTTMIDKSVFAWQLGTGVGLKASDKVVVDLGLRYFKPSNVKDGGTEITCSSMNVLAGVRYSF